MSFVLLPANPLGTYHTSVLSFRTHSSFHSSCKVKRCFPLSLSQYLQIGLLGLESKTNHSCQVFSEDYLLKTGFYYLLMYGYRNCCTDGFAAISRYFMSEVHSSAFNFAGLPLCDWTWQQAL